MVSGQMMVEAVETVENDLECESDDTGAVRVLLRTRTVTSWWVECQLFSQKQF